jgi:hypothetical protein
MLDKRKHEKDVKEAAKKTWPKETFKGSDKEFEHLHEVMPHRVDRAGNHLSLAEYMLLMTPEYCLVRRSRYLIENKTIDVSTIFLGCDFIRSRPKFETMVFRTENEGIVIGKPGYGIGYDSHVETYYSEEAAEEGHRKQVDLLLDFCSKQGLKPVLLSDTAHGS